MCGHPPVPALCIHHLLEFSQHSSFSCSEKTEVHEVSNFPMSLGQRVTNQASLTPGPTGTLNVATAAGRVCLRPALNYSIYRLTWFWHWGPDSNGSEP